MTGQENEYKIRVGKDRPEQSTQTFKQFSFSCVCLWLWLEASGPSVNKAKKNKKTLVTHYVPGKDKQFSNALFWESACPETGLHKWLCHQEILVLNIWSWTLNMWHLVLGHCRPGETTRQGTNESNCFNLLFWRCSHITLTECERAHNNKHLVLDDMDSPQNTQKTRFKNLSPIIQAQHSFACFLQINKVPACKASFKEFTKIHQVMQNLFTF